MSYHELMVTSWDSRVVALLVRQAPAKGMNMRRSRDGAAIQEGRRSEPAEGQVVVRPRDDAAKQKGTVQGCQ